MTLTWHMAQSMGTKTGENLGADSTHLISTWKCNPVGLKTLGFCVREKYLISCFYFFQTFEEFEAAIEQENLEEFLKLK